MSGPSPARIKAVVEYLQETLGLEISGQCGEFDGGWFYEAEGGALMTYSADDILALRKALHNDRIIRQGQE